MKLQQIQSFITLIKSAYTQPNVDESLYAILTLIEDAIKNELQGEILSGKLTPNDMKYIEGKNHAKFTDKEIDKMPRKFHSLFKTRKLYAHVRKTEDDVYEVRRVHKGHIIYGHKQGSCQSQSKIYRALTPNKLQRSPIKRKKHLSATLLHV